MNDDISWPQIQVRQKNIYHTSAMSCCRQACVLYGVFENNEPYTIATIPVRIFPVTTMVNGTKPKKMHSTRSEKMPASFFLATRCYKANRGRPIQRPRFLQHLPAASLMVDFIFVVMLTRKCKVDETIRIEFVVFLLSLRLFLGPGTRTNRQQNRRLDTCVARKINK